MISNENFFKQENVFCSFYLRYLHLVRFLFLFHDCNRLHVFSDRVIFFFIPACNLPFAHLPQYTLFIVYCISNVFNFSRDYYN